MHAIGAKNFMSAWTFTEVHSLADIFGEFQLGRVSNTDYAAVRYGPLKFVVAKLADSV